MKYSVQFVGVTNQPMSKDLSSSQGFWWLRWGSYQMLTVFYGCDACACVSSVGREEN